MVAWPEAVVERFWRVCCCVMDVRTSQLFEMKVRSGTGTEALGEIKRPHGADCGCAHEGHHAAHDRDSLSPFCFKKREDDTLGAELQRLVSKRFFCQDSLAPVAEEAARLYETLAASSPITSTEMKAQAQAYCLSRAIEKTLVSALKRTRTQSERMSVQDGGRLAYPQAYKTMFPKSPYLALLSIPADSMAELMGSGYTVIPDWLDPTLKCGDDALPVAASKDFEWIEMHSLLEDQTPFSPDPFRTDSTFWLNAGEILPNLKGLAAFSLKLTSLPFELNNKLQAKLSINNMMLLELLKPKSYYRKHKDNSPDNENGRTFTAMYSMADRTQVTLWVDDGAPVRLKLAANSLLLFKSRHVAYELPAQNLKRQLIAYWLQGLNDI